MLQFRIDWEDEPRIQDPLLRASWARLEILAGDASPKFCLTDCLGEPSHSLRRGVYGSVFPLAEWIVENWWSLLNESLRIDRFRGARSLAKDDALRPWVQRHSLLAARGGFALPDLTIFQDGCRTAVRCVPDPFDLESAYPVRFVRDLDLRMEPAQAELGLARFVESVIDRVRGLAPDEPGTKELLSNWEAVHESARTERDVCVAAASMGLDPYDPEQLSDELVELLEGPFGTLSPSLRGDLAESTTGDAVRTDLNWVLAAASATGREPAETCVGPRGKGELAPAHQAGYERARWFIGQFGQPPVDDLEGFVRARCGWSGSSEPLMHVPGVSSRINAFVGPDNSGKPRLIPAAPREAEPSRFQLGRALFFAPSVDSHLTQRLLTRASAWPQRASRAFAAELLVPAEQLRKHVAGQVTFEQVAELAREFRVSAMVVVHQLENHRIARIVDL
jgi:hypothetical protein